MCRNEHILIGSLGDNDALTVSNSNHDSNTFIIFQLHLNKNVFWAFFSFFKYEKSDKWQMLSKLYD